MSRRIYVSTQPRTRFPALEDINDANICIIDTPSSNRVPKGCRRSRHSSLLSKKAEDLFQLEASRPPPQAKADVPYGLKIKPTEGWKVLRAGRWMLHAAAFTPRFTPSSAILPKQATQQWIRYINTALVCYLFTLIGLLHIMKNMCLYQGLCVNKRLGL